jgi:hypothetical protein
VGIMPNALPDAEALRLRFEVHGCRVFDNDKVGAAAVLVVDGGGDVSPTVGKGLSIEDRLAASAMAHRLIFAPELVPQWLREAGSLAVVMGGGAEAAPRRVGLQDRALALLPTPQRLDMGQPACLASTARGARCSRHGGWVSSGYCWQHWQQRSEWIPA